MEMEGGGEWAWKKAAKDESRRVQRSIQVVVLEGRAM